MLNHVHISLSGLMTSNTVNCINIFRRLGDEGKQVEDSVAGAEDPVFRKFKAQLKRVKDDVDELYGCSIEPWVCTRFLENVGKGRK